MPKAKPAFPFNIIMHTMAAKAAFAKRFSPDDTFNYGRYFVQVASCRDCHNNNEKGEFTGGHEFQEPAGTLRVASITPDVKTGGLSAAGCLYRTNTLLWYYANFYFV